jgi:hypothetical protein
MKFLISEIVQELGSVLGQVDDAIDSREVDRARVEIEKALPIYKRLAQVCHAVNQWKRSEN